MNPKFTYYAGNYLRQLLPRRPFHAKLPHKLTAARAYDQDYLNSRVDYYNKLEGQRSLGEACFPLSEFRFGIKPKTYFFDAYRYLRYFPPQLRVCFLFGDVTTVPQEPSFVKSRPIEGDNANSVLLKLNWIRHFNFVNDRRPWRSKRDILVGRSNVTQENRKRFLKSYFGHRLCDVGQVNREGGDRRWLMPRMSIREHLRYKFVLCLEGNDVASNLKWVMSSNSLAVMPPPRYETWFMEGRLEADQHYVALRDDYADLEEKLLYYQEHPAEAEAILARAHEHVAQFRNPGREEAISFLTIQKYFKKTGQGAQLTS